MVYLAVVIARQRADAFGSELLDVAQFAILESSGKDVEMTLVGSRNKHQPLSVGREPRLEVHHAAGRELSRASIVQVEQPQLNGIVVVARKSDPTPIRRPVGLVVIARPCSQLLGHRAVHILPPQRPGHRVNQHPGIRRPGRRAWSGSELRQVHLAIVIRMWEVNLLEHRLPLRQAGGAE